MKKLLWGFLFSGLLFASGPAGAANFDDPIHGIFKAATGDMVTIEIPSNVNKSSDNAPGELSFQVNASTGYKGFNQLTDLKAGDVVAVDYTTSEKTQKLLATMISTDVGDKLIKTTTTTTTVHTY